MLYPVWNRFSIVANAKIWAKFPQTNKNDFLQSLFYG